MMIDPAILLQAYSIGVFPMADDRDAAEVYWVEPKQRAILPLDGFHLSRSLAKTLRRDPFRVTANRAFPAILALCAQPAPDRPPTWINRAIEAAYRHLHAIGYAHSVETWVDLDGRRTLAGGLYGVAIGRVFYGESMFCRVSDASKIALAHLCRLLERRGFVVIDCQMNTAHLASLGAREIPRQAFVAGLAQWTGDAGVGAECGGRWPRDAADEFFRKAP